MTNNIKTIIQVNFPTFKFPFFLNLLIFYLSSTKHSKKKKIPIFSVLINTLYSHLSIVNLMIRQVKTSRIRPRKTNI
jgi:hypothetical protein